MFNNLRTGSTNLRAFFCSFKFIYVFLSLYIRIPRSDNTCVTERVNYLSIKTNRKSWSKKRYNDDRLSLYFKVSGIIVIFTVSRLYPFLFSLSFGSWKQQAERGGQALWSYYFDHRWNLFWIDKNIESTGHYMTQWKVIEYFIVQEYILVKSATDDEWLEVDVVIVGVPIFQTCILLLHVLCCFQPHALLCQPQTVPVMSTSGSCPPSMAMMAALAESTTLILRYCVRITSAFSHH